MNTDMRLCVIPNHHGRVREIQPGDFFSVQVTIKNIPNNTALACYGVELNFDPDLIEFKEILFGDPLSGDQLDLHSQGTIQTPLVDEAAVGTIGIVETSKSDMHDCIDIQPKEFTLAVVKFQARNEGVCTIQPGWGIEQLEGPSVGQGMGPCNLYGAVITVGSRPSVSVIAQKQQVGLEEEILVQLFISGISPRTALACYGVKLNFDPDLIQFKEILFGDPLSGDQLDPHGQGTIQTPLIDDAAVGTIGIVETSKSDMHDCIDIQPKEFTLAVVKFQAKSEGICTIQLEWGIEQLEGPSVGQGMGPGDLYGASVNIGEPHISRPLDFRKE